jgi:branched-subunit amino acid transport protein
MDVRAEFLALVLACAAVTAVPRVLPLLVLSKLRLPQWLLDWLGYVPVAVLAALLSLEATGAGPAGLLATALALAVAWTTRSLLGTVLAGLALYWVLL